MKTQSIYKLPLLLLCISSLYACSSNPERETGSATDSHEQAIYMQAKKLYDKQEYIAAAALLKPIAENGNADAQYSLGYLYYNGLGTKRDLNSAYSWIKKAADSGQRDAIIALQQIKSIEQTTRAAPAPSVAQPIPMNSRPEPLPERSDLLKTPASSPDVKTDSGIHTDTTAPQEMAITQQPGKDSTYPPSYALSQEIVNAPEPETGTAKETAKQPAAELTTTNAPANDSLLAYRNQSRAWIEQQPPGYYTIQIASFSREEATLQFRDSNPLGKMYYFRNPSAITVWYSVIYGSFPSLGDARKELVNARKQGFEYAWIRNFSDVQNKIKEQK